MNWNLIFIHDAYVPKITQIPGEVQIQLKINTSSNSGGGGITPPIESYLPLSGGELSGNLNMNNNSINNAATISATSFIGTLTGNASTATVLLGNIPESQVTNLASDLAAKAPLASPTFTGVVSAGAGNFTAGGGTLSINTSTNVATINGSLTISGEAANFMGGGNFTAGAETLSINASTGVTTLMGGLTLNSNGSVGMGGGNFTAGGGNFEVNASTGLATFSGAISCDDGDITSNGDGNLTAASFATSTGTFNNFGITLKSGTVSLDNAQITSDGSGNLTAIAFIDGGAYGCELSLDTLNSDGGDLISDGNGNLSAISFQGGAIVGGVLSLSFSSTIATNASENNTFDITATGNFTLSNPINASDGQAITWRITQDSTGSRIMTLGSNFHLPSSGPSSIVLSTTPNTKDILSVKFDSNTGKFDVVSFVPGY